jgi:hypothetical protein
MATEVKITEYTVNAVPGESIDAHAYGITVAYAGHDRWAIRLRGRCLNTDGQWDYEPIPSERDDDWLTAHRYDRDIAIGLAVEHAPNVTVNGVRAADLTQES